MEKSFHNEPEVDLKNRDAAFIYAPFEIGFGLLDKI